jgi:hypothetical protein
MQSVVLVNLRVLSKLQPGDRLQCCDSRFFGIDRGYLTWLWRWMKADTRQITLERLDDTVKEAMTAGGNEPLLIQARDGLAHLVETYHTDPTTVARLEAIIARMAPGDELEL